MKLININPKYLNNLSIKQRRALHYISMNTDDDRFLLDIVPIKLNFILGNSLNGHYWSFDDSLYAIQEKICS